MYKIYGTPYKKDAHMICELNECSEEFARGYACCLDSVINEGFADCDEDKEIISLWEVNNSYERFIMAHRI